MDMKAHGGRWYTLYKGWIGDMKGHRRISIKSLRGTRVL